jgi:hypothetical protein
MAEKLHSGSRNGYPSIEPVEISDDDIRREIALEAEARLNMTYEDFVEAYQDGTLPDTLAANELAMLQYFVEYSGDV